MAKEYTHVTLPRTEEVTKVILVQLGSPKSPKVGDVRIFLRKFLGDPRVVDINPTLWKIILNLFVLPFRPARSAKLYSRIWDGHEFPLIKNTREFASRVNELTPKNVEVEYAFLLSSPSIEDVYDNWLKELQTKSVPASKIIVVPLFPQYSESTIGSGIDFFFHVLKKKVIIPDFRFITQFHKLKSFIDLSVLNIKKAHADDHFEDLIISFHGIPKRRVIYKNDPYYQHCFETFLLIKKHIDFFPQDKIHMTFQSRFGSEEWLTPYTEEYINGLIDNGQKSFGVYSPSFVADCLETTDELGHELKNEVHEKGAKLVAIPCLNAQENWCEGFGQYVTSLALDDKKVKDLEYNIEAKEYQAMSKQTMQSPPISDEGKKSLKMVFLTLFLDLVGFSIIFPLFPTLAKYYLEVDKDNYFLNLIFGTIANFTNSVGVSDFSSIVLFGGALGAIYSFLQFFASPFWGSLSDRIGRRPILLISVFGLFVSYVIWFFSGNFTLLILARFVGGIMGGNISTATAVVADVTTSENRSKGMATIGIAFALGFIIGPAIGGLSSLIDLTKIYPELVAYGVNPFSVPALIAGALSLFNFVNLLFKFKETLPEKTTEVVHVRTSNIFTLLKPLPYEGVNLTNFGHFLFLMAFSGMEFTLTFLAAERLSYTSMDNAYMFIFIGFIIALVQGGYVRRKAHLVGEKKMARNGLVAIIPGLLLIAYAQNSFFIYAGLFFLAVGSSMSIPCLTALASLYSPKDKQGQCIGIFRSLGALARVFGPIIASVVYWKYNSAAPYLIGAAFMIIPIYMISKLPNLKKETI